MKKYTSKILVVTLLILGVLYISACSVQKNDREYFASELVGNYTYSVYDKNTKYITTYYLDISETSAKPYANAYHSKITRNQERAGLDPIKEYDFNGRVHLTDDNIKIQGLTGFIQTINNKIEITINGITYTKIK